MKCEFIKKCPIPGARDREQWREEAAQKFCDSNCEQCVRYAIRKNYGISAVPETLHPDGSTLKNSVFKIGEN